MHCRFSSGGARVRKTSDAFPIPKIALCHRSIHVLAMNMYLHLLNLNSVFTPTVTNEFSTNETNSPLILGSPTTRVTLSQDMNFVVSGERYQFIIWSRNWRRYNEERTSS